MVFTFIWETGHDCGFALIVALCYLLKKNELSDSTVNISIANCNGIIIVKTGCCSHCNRVLSFMQMQGMDFRSILIVLV